VAHLIVVNADDLQVDMLLLVLLLPFYAILVAAADPCLVSGSSSIWKLTRCTAAAAPAA
jgi:hypothetical protein